MTTAPVEKAPWTLYGPPVRNRSCGSCTACCTLVATELADERKPAGVRCKHVCRKGCGIYDHRPSPCQYWSCRWLMDPLAAGLKRPDLGGYVVDPALDTMMNNGQPFETLQVWLDPARPDAHRAPELRAYLAAVAARFGLPAIVRRRSPDMFLLLAPSLTGKADWTEAEATVHTQKELDAHLARAGTTSWIKRL